MQVFYVLSRTVIWGLKYLLPQSHEECADEEPVHEVYLDDYLIDRDEINAAQYRGECRSGDLSGTGPGRGLQLGAQTSTPLDLTPKKALYNFYTSKEGDKTPLPMDPIP